MTFLQSLILGIIQGLTEFLPVSSSAHLVLVPYFLNWKIPESQVFPFDVLVQIGTLVAVIIYFWKDLVSILKAFFRGLMTRKPFEEPNSRLGWYLILASIPAGLAGIFLKSKVEEAFNSPRMTAFFLLGTAVLLLAAEFFSHRSRRLDQMKWLDAVWIGIFQAISIFPGISRSGSTITGGMTRNLDRPSAARFSFLMSIPIMAAAGAVSIKDLMDVPELGSFLPLVAVGFIAALVVGYLSIHWLLGFVKKRSLVYFAAYCALLAIAVLITGSVRGNTTAPIAGETPTPAGSPSALSVLNQATSTDITQVEYTASLDWLIPVMTACANTTPGVSIVTHLVSGNQSQPSEKTILFRWGQPPQLTDFSTQLGISDLEMVVNPKNPLNSLTSEVIRLISSGKTTSWGEIYQKCPECFDSAPGDEISKLPPKLNFYSQGEEAQDLFEQLVLAGTPVARASATLVPSALSMLEAVSGAPDAIGFLPSRSANESVKPVILTGFEKSQLSLPILAISLLEPQASARAWLACIQQTLNT